MSRVSRALPHLTAESLKQKFRTAKNFWQQQKWLVIYNALVEPRAAEEIAKHTGVSLSTVHQAISEYNRYGERAIETPGRGGRVAVTSVWQQKESSWPPLSPKQSREASAQQLQSSVLLSSSWGRGWLPQRFIGCWSATSGISSFLVRIILKLS
jgi:hypothetical protein